MEAVKAESTSAPVHFMTNKSIEDDYELSTNELGRGYFAVVRKGKNLNTGHEVAVKCIKKKKVEDKKKLQSEVSILASLQEHPNIVTLYGVYDSEKHLYLVLELMSPQDLYDEIIERENLTEKQASKVMKQVLTAISFIHSNKIVHRDIKLENLLLKKKGDLSTIKVTDFGLSKCCETSLPRSAVGTPFYVSPDLLIAIDDKSPYTFAIDMWALGVLLFIVLSGRLPFTGQDDEELFDNILEANIIWKSPQFDAVSNEAKDLISQLLRKDPQFRPTAEEALKHPFITANSSSSSLHPSLSANLIRSYKKNRSTTSS